MGTIKVNDYTYPQATLDYNAANIEDIQNLDNKIKKNAEMIDNITEFIIPGLQQDLDGHIKRVDNISDRRLNTLEKHCADLEEEVIDLKDKLQKTIIVLCVTVTALIAFILI